jgi:hypothetical protein
MSIFYFVDCMLRANASISVQSHFDWGVKGDVFIAPPTIRTIYLFSVLPVGGTEDDGNETIDDIDDTVDISLHVELKTEVGRVHFPLSALHLTAILRLEESVEDGWRVHRSLSQLVLTREHWTQVFESLPSEVVAAPIEEAVDENFEHPSTSVPVTRRKVQELRSQLLLIEEADLNTVGQYVSVRQTVHMSIIRN